MRSLAFLVPLLVLAGCSGNAAITPARHLSGIFAEEEADLQGTGRARLIFSFHEGEGKVQGGVKVITEDPRPSRAIRFAPVSIKRVSKSHHVVFKDAEGNVHGTAELGGELGKATFSGRLTELGFEYTLTDKLGTITGVAPYQAPYNAPGLHNYYKDRTFAGTIQGSEAYGDYPLWTWSPQTIRLRTTNVRSDGMGGVEFDVTALDPIPGAVGTGTGDDCGGCIIMWYQDAATVSASVLDLTTAATGGSQTGWFAAKTGTLGVGGAFTGTAGESSASITAGH